MELYDKRCKLRCVEMKVVVRYEIWCDTIYNAVRDMAIYEIARYMRYGDIQNISDKEDVRYDMCENTRYLGTE